MSYEVDAPKWLDKNLLTIIIEQHDSEEVEMVKFTVTSAVPPGNNYLSDLLRVKAEYKDSDSSQRTLFLIFKAPIINESQKEIQEEVDIYAKELKIYSLLLPKLREKLKHDFGPKYYPCQTNVKNLLVLQDLKEEGYVMRERWEQLDFEHCKEVIVATAKFHAASVACMSESKDLSMFNQGPVFDEKDPTIERLKLMVVDSARRVADLTKNMKECKGFSDYILSNIDNLCGVIRELYEPPYRHDQFKVMVHGDMWTNNIMFKYDKEGHIEDVKFVDFQLTRYDSPVADVMLFVWSSGDIKDCQNRHQELYDLYLERLNQTLEELGCKERYSPEEYQEDVKRGIYKVLVVICQLIPILVSDPETGTFKMEELNPDTDTGRSNLNTVYEGKYYRKKLPVLAKQYLKWLSSLKKI